MFPRSMSHMHTICLVWMWVQNVLGRSETSGTLANGNPHLIVLLTERKTLQKLKCSVLSNAAREPTPRWSIG